jgi:hypothetical protein
MGIRTGAETREWRGCSSCVCRCAGWGRAGPGSHPLLAPGVLFPQEGLYEEEMAKKVRATGMIAQLFRNTENFEVRTTSRAC